MDLSQIIYLIPVVLSAPLLFIVVYFLFMKYRENKNIQSLYLARAFFIFGIGDVLLILEQTVLNLAYPNQTTIIPGALDEEIARVLVCVAIFMVAFGLWYLNAFSLSFLPGKENTSM